MNAPSFQRILRRALASAAILALAASSVVAAPQRGERPPPPPPEGPRERWERLDPEERERLRERFERFRDLEEGQQTSLEERVRYLQGQMLRVERELAPATRAKLDALEPGLRQRALCELALQRERERGERMLRALPPHERERFENASPEEKARILFELQGRMRERGGPRSIEHLARELGLPAQEVARLNSLPPEERMRELPRLRKAVELRRAEKRGPPPFVTEEQWRELIALPPQEFCDRFEKLRRADEAARGGDPNRGPGGLGSPRGPGGPGGPDGPGGEPGGPGGPRFGGRGQDVRRVMEALRPTADDVIETVHLEREERFIELAVRSRARVVAVLRETKLVSPERIAEIEAIPREQLRPEALRARFERWLELRRGPGGRGGPPGEGPPGPPREGPQRGGVPRDG